MTKPLRTGDLIRLVNPAYGEPSDDCVVIADQHGSLVWFAARSGSAAFVARRRAVRLIKTQTGEQPMMQLHTSGRLVRDPAQKTSANGKAYVQSLMTASSGDGEALITLMVFDTGLSSLLASLKRGDSVSAIGSASIRAYTDKDGQPAAGVTIMVTRLMAMTARAAAPRPRDIGQRQRTAATPAGPPDLPPIEAYNDPIPF